MMKTKRAIIFLSLWLFLCAVSVCQSTAHAERVDLDGMNLVFVDARNSTGYYVDTNSYEFKNDNEVTSRVEMVKADIDRLYLYTIRFDRAKKIYQIMNSIVAEYASKEKVGGSAAPMQEQSYASGSPLASVVDYIFNPIP